MLRFILIEWLVLFPLVIHAQSQIIRAGSFELIATPVDPEGNAILSSIGQMPEYPGGLDSLYAWLLRNITYPAEARKNNLEGTVITKFIVDTNGMVTEVSVYKRVHPSLDSVCFNAVKDMKPWSPAIIEGKPERVQFLLPIRFILTCDDNCMLRINVMDSLMALSNSVVTLSSASFNNISFSDTTGSLRFDSLPAGRYRLNILHPGYHIFDTLIDIQRCTSDYSFQLRPFSDADSLYTEYSEFTTEGALRDIANNNMRILLPGGLIQETINASDSLFEQKYHVRFLNRGCVRLPGEDQNTYNQEIFKYLDNKYGRRWRREIRQDAIGLQKKKRMQ